MIETRGVGHLKRAGSYNHGVEWSDRATSPLLRSDFAQSTAGQPPNGDLTDSFVPSDGRAVPQ